MSTKHSFCRVGDRKELNYNHNYRSRSKHQKKSHSPPNSHKEKRGNAHRDNENKYIRDSSKYYRHDSRNKSPKKHKSTRKEDRSEDKKKYHHNEHKPHKNYDNKYKHYDEHHFKKKKESSSSESSQSPKKQKMGSEEGKDRTKDEGHYKYEIGEVIINRYKILKHLSDGTFGRVFEVFDLRENRICAMKIIRAVERYVESAKTEAEILLDMRKKDPEGKYQIVQLLDAFEYKKNYCMIFEKLGLSLYELLKKNDYRGYPIDLIQSFFQQILISIGFMHSNSLTHTDLKPENILLVSDDCVTVDYLDIKDKVDFSHHYYDDDRSSTCSKSEKKEYHIPKNEKIKIIDFGGATYAHEHHSSVINTRQYRAPEIILSCCEWNHMSDMWCIACIVIELYSGDLLFETHESYEHLAMVEKVSGHIPYWMCYGADRSMSKHFVFTEEHYRKSKTYFDWPKYAKDKTSYMRVKNMKVVKDIIAKEHKELADLLIKMLEIDPSKRIDCTTALKHPFFSIKYKKVK